jgi:hypothetical protein
MANPYVAPTVTDYNLNPPSDDGTQSPSNALTWAKHKTKIGDPLKTAIEADIAATTTAFGKLAGGITAVVDDYTVLASDQGKTIVISVSGKTITTPDADGTGIGAGFKFGILNTSSGDVTIDGSDSQTVDGTATVTLPSLRGVDVDTDGSNWFTKGQNWEAVGFANPHGRLTLTSATPVLTANTTAQATVYYTPYIGNTIKLWNGTKFFSVTFAEVSQALSDDTKSPAAAATDSLYDMFGWLDGTTFRVTRGPAWLSATSRSTGAGTTELERVQGVLMNKVSISNGPAANRGIYLGTIMTNGSTQMAMNFEPAAASGGTANRLDVWNMYNRVDVLALMRDSANTWNVASANTWASANASASNRVTFVRGLDDEKVRATYSCAANIGTDRQSYVGIGLDITNGFTGMPGAAGIADGTGSEVSSIASYGGRPGIGRHFLQAVERANHTSAVTFYGDNNAATLTQMGMTVELRM